MPIRDVVDGLLRRRPQVAARRIVGRIDTREVGGEDASVLLYDLEGRRALLVTAKSGGEVEVWLDADQAAHLAQLLQSPPANVGPG